MLEQLIRAIDLALESFDDTLYDTAKEHDDEAIFMNQDQLSKGFKPSGEQTPFYKPESITKKQNRGTLYGNKTNWSLKDSGDWYAKMQMNKTLFGFEIDTTSQHRTLVSNPESFMGLSLQNEEKFAESISDEFSDKLITIIESGL